MRKSTSKPWGKWYESFPYVWYGFRGWSEEDKALALQEIEEDRKAKLEANLMMAEHSFGQAHDWVFNLNPDVRDYREYMRIGLTRSNAVRKWLRAFWAEEDVPIRKPNLLYLSSTPGGNNWVRETWMEGKEESSSRSVDFKKYFQCEWSNDAVYSREEVAGKLERGEISEHQADEMLSLRWKVNSKGEKVQICVK